jgi:CheY-like chemotaxis protein
MRSSAGGAVAAASEGPGRGSTFSIRLPLAPPPSAGQGDADAADTLSMMLNLDGHETATAYCARDAMLQADVFRPETILLDIGLPGTDGYEVARRIRAMPLGASVKLIALTGYGQTEDRARAVRDGFDDHLVKPTSPELLRKALAAERP